MATTTLPEAEVEVSRQENKKSATKYVYSFGGGKADGNGKMKDDLGGKGAGLAEMTNAGLPVPPGFTIISWPSDGGGATSRPTRRPSGGNFSGWMVRSFTTKSLTVSSVSLASAGAAKGHAADDVSTIGWQRGRSVRFRTQARLNGRDDLCQTDAACTA